MSGTPFRYELEAARVRASSRLDDATRRLSAVRRRLRQDEDTHAALRMEIEQLGRGDGAGAGLVLVPQLAIARTEHLVRLLRRAMGLEQTLVATKRELEQVLEETRMRHIERESFERHRELRSREHARQLGARAAAEADQAWLARAAWLESSAPRIAANEPASSVRKEGS